MTADEILKELGYAKIKDNDVHIIYKTDYDKKILFTKLLKTATASICYDDKKRIPVALNIYEIAGIYKKMKELGWLK